MKRLQLSQNLYIINACKECPALRYAGEPFCGMSGWAIDDQYAYPPANSCPLEDFIPNQETNNFLQIIFNSKRLVIIEINPHEAFGKTSIDYLQMLVEWQTLSNEAYKAIPEENLRQIGINNKLIIIQVHHMVETDDPYFIYHWDINAALQEVVEILEGIKL